ncbi:MAG: ATP-binding protein [Phascolarctobacterium sp.]
MRQELRETSIYNAIIEAIALGNTKLNDIYQKTQIDKSKLSVYLKNLLDLGIVAREFPVATSIKERANSQRGIYKLTDNFFRFWYAFVFPNLSELESGYRDGVYNYIIAPDLDQYTSFTFEEICRQYLRALNHQGKLPFFASSMGHWWDKETEIDILAMDKKQQNLLLCECKYKNTPVDVKDIKHLQAKKPYDAANVFYYFFSKSGYTKAAETLAAEQGVALLTSKDIVKGEE